MTKLPIKYKGYVIAESNKQGGKAGRGKNKTATIQVREPLLAGNYLLRWQFRYALNVTNGREVAVTLAKDWIEAL
jgi:hypothetical protein